MRQWHRLQALNVDFACIFKIIKQGLLRQRMKGNNFNMVDLSSQQEEYDPNPYQIESINEDGKYLKSFDGQHQNYFLSLRRKHDSKFEAEDHFDQLPVLGLHKMHSASEQREKQGQFDDQKDNSLIFRPKNKRKVQQNAVKIEHTINKIRENAPFTNPQKTKKQGKLLTRKSEEYQPQSQWFQGQNPANLTLQS